MKDSNNVTSSEASSGNPSSISSSLLRRLREQQPDAWERLARFYGPLVYHWCLRAGLQAADAEDVVQEVFRTLAAKIEGFRRERDTDTFRGWLWTITRNKIGDVFRRREGRMQGIGGTDAQQRLGELPADESASGTADSLQAGTLYLQTLELMRGEFEQNSWQAFWRLVVDDQSPADVAADLGISVNAVYIAKSRIMRRLREELGDSPE